jgi:tetratricopeptide (TPR) repeat protein
MASVATGTLLKDRYRIERLLGRGGMASVWRANDLVLDRAVAVKVLSDTIASDPEFVARFRREARIAAKLWHPNLVGVYDYAAEAERPYLVLEYVPGPNLAERLSQGARIDCERLARELLGAVARIHAAGILHRDIKPQNVLLAPDGSAKLIDFGIALPPDATALTRTGHLLGTARYLAPEVMSGGVASERSDLYSCGVLLRACLGEEPPPRLRALVERLSADDPRRRPASAEQALARLRQRPQLPDQATQRLRPVAPLPVIEPAGQRRRWGRAVAGAGALAALAAAFLIVGGGGDAAKDGGSRRASAIAAAPEQGGGARKTSRDQSEQATSSAETPGESSAEAESREPASPAPLEAAEDPETGSALNQEGFEMIQAGRYEEAVPVLEQAVDSFPSGSEELDYAYALFNLGNALRLSGRPREAIPVLERRLEFPNQTDVVQRELAAAENEAAGSP